MAIFFFAVLFNYLSSLVEANVLIILNFHKYKDLVSIVCSSSNTSTRIDDTLLQFCAVLMIYL